MKYARVTDNKITEISYQPIAGWESVSDDVFAGFEWDGSTWVAPAPDISYVKSVEKEKRNRLLQETDWTQVADAPVDQAAWAVYRQALRDVPQQEGFPYSITWPVKPE